MSVQVLCPNGRRQTVKLTPNSKLIQILEEVCLKQGYAVDEYDLKHGTTTKRTLDLSVIYRYSGLPNHAKLELIKCEKKRTLSNVTVALQLESGERLQNEFSPDTSLSRVLQQWSNQTQSKPGLQRVLIYLREEIIGEVALAETTLKKLGLVSGKGLLRLVYREVDNAVLEEIEEKIRKERAKIARMSSTSNSASSSHNAASVDNKREREGEGHMDTAPIPCVSDTAMDTSSLPGQPKVESMDTDDESNAKVFVSNSEPIPNGLKDDGKRKEVVTQSDNTAWTGGTQAGGSQQSPSSAAGGMEISLPGSNDELPPHIRAQVQQLASSLLPGADSSILQDMMSAVRAEVRGAREARRGGGGGARNQPSQQFKFPESTKGKQVYKNELSQVNRQEYKACDRETVVYSTEENRPITNITDEELPDSFFEVTEADLRKQLVEQRAIAESEQVLMTSSMRQAQKESRMEKYPRVIIRVHFPERIILQGVFNVRETVHALYKYVKDHLEDKTQEFYLYTTPPKKVLKDRSSNLFEADLAPMCVIHFGSEGMKEHSLSAAVLGEKTTQQVADQIVIKHMSHAESSTSNSEASTSGLNSTPSSSSSRAAVPGTSSGAASRAPSSGRPLIPQTEPSKVPKWFKAGKK